MLCRDVIGGPSQHISVADTAIARLSTVRTVQFVTALCEANAAVDADVVPHVGDAGEVDSHCAYSGTGAFRDTNRAGFIYMGSVSQLNAPPSTWVQGYFG